LAVCGLGLIAAEGVDIDLGSLGSNLPLENEQPKKREKGFSFAELDLTVRLWWYGFPRVPARGNSDR